MKQKSFLKLAVLVGSLLVFFVASAGAAMKYTERAQFCNSCHVMAPMFNSWGHSAHRQVSCNDCHAPAGKGEKLFFKATSGLGHVYANTLGEVPENIRMKEKSARIIQANCLRCHGELLADTKMGGGKYCFDCHRDTPHGQ